MGRSIEWTRLQTTTEHLSSVNCQMQVTATHQRIFNLPTEVCTGTAKTKEQSQRRAFNLIPIMVSPTTDRLVRTGTQRNSSWPGETFSNQRPNTLPQTCLSLRAFPLQSCGGPYIVVTYRLELYQQQAVAIPQKRGGCEARRAFGPKHPL
jgi:hypothetical protein